MKKILHLALLCLSFSAFGQAQNDRQFFIGEMKSRGDTVQLIRLKTEVYYVTDGMVTKTVTPPSDTARLFLSSDGQEFIGTTTWKRKNTWSIYAIMENNNTSAIAYSSGWNTNSTGAAKFFADNFAWITAPTVKQSAGTQLSTTFPIRFSFWSERFAGHKPYDLIVKINGVIADSVRIDPNLPPLGSDKDSGKPSYLSRQLNPSAPGVLTEFKLVVKSTGQMALDRIMVESLK